MQLSDADISKVVDNLNRDGISVLHGVLSPTVVTAMRTEVDRMFSHPATGVRFEDHLAGRSLRLKMKRLRHEAAPTITDLFQSEWMRNIALAYDPQCRFCSDAVVTHDTNPGRITDTHFDMRPSLKCMVYLTDVDAASGAFRYAPGTHLQNREFRLRFLRSGRALKRLPNVVGPAEPVSLQDMEGPAGTLLIFDTDGFHSGGTLQLGRDRLVIRARTILHGWFNNPALRLLARLPINPLRLFPPPVPEGRLASAGTARAASVPPRRAEPALVQMAHRDLEIARAEQPATDSHGGHRQKTPESLGV